MILSIVNKKGGTGKTTTTINLGKGLTLKGHRVLLVDLDPQGNLSYSLGVSPEEANLGEAMEKGFVATYHIESSDGIDTRHFCLPFLKWVECAYSTPSSDVHAE